MRDVVILGSTGSVGTQALDVLADRRTQFRIAGLAAGGSQPALLARQALDFEAPAVAIQQASAAQDLQLHLYAEAARRGWSAGELRLPQILAGPDAAERLAGRGADVVLNAITGAAGLTATLAALRAGSTLALANKESLVIGGRLVTEAAAPGQIVPVDSEHSALAQALRAGRAEEVDRLIVTASGGPFRGQTADQLRDATPEQAMAHPTWQMGRVITINSATLVNKALEVLEAHLLYGVGLDRIDVVIHPQSIVHSMVQFCDGSTIAQCSPHDMRLPIALALSWPKRMAGVSAPLDWRAASSWTFEPLDGEAFPAVALGYRCGAAGGTAPAVYNAANEVAVDAFCAGEIGFTGIVDVIAAVVAEHLAPATAPSLRGGVPSQLAEHPDLDAVLGADRWARERARELVDKPRNGE